MLRRRRPEPEPCFGNAAVQTAASAWRHTRLSFALIAGLLCAGLGIASMSAAGAASLERWTQGDVPWNISSLPSTVILDAALVPRLVVEADLAWDEVDPAALAAKTVSR